MCSSMVVVLQCRVTYLRCSASKSEVRLLVQEILTESFDPIVELTTGADLMMAMVYAQELGDWDYTGMYTAILRHKVSCNRSFQG